MPVVGGGEKEKRSLTEGTNIHERIENLGIIFSFFSDVPEEWLSKPGSTKGEAGKPGMELTPCEDYREVIMAWKKAMKWTYGLECALSVMLSSAMSTMQRGDQLWVKIIGPASCGKSTLCEAVSTNAKYVLAKSTVRGFHSGFSDSESGEDVSLISKVKGKTLVTKDGDTLLQSPNLGQILSEARDIYDTVSRTSYRNKQSRDYQGIRMTWILCGTSSLRSIDSSELGERFLDCVIMDGIDDDLEDEILQRVVYRAERNLSFSVEEELDTHQDEEMTNVMKITGGYINHLRANASFLLKEVKTSEEIMRAITRLGKFIAYMRARPSKLQTETAEREFAARLVSQLMRLCKCLAAVMGKREIDDSVMRRVRKVSMDTSRGATLEIARLLYKYHDEGMEVRAVAMLSKQTEDESRKLLRFLAKIGVTELFMVRSVKSTAAKPRWRLTEKFKELYTEVFSDFEEEV